MSEFEFEFPETLPNEHLNFIEETCIYWIPTFKIKKNYSKEERIAKYRQIVNRDIKNEIFEILKGLTLKEFNEVVRRLQNQVNNNTKIS